MISAWSDTRQLRVGLLFFGAALLFNFHLLTIGWDNTLLGTHQFRQVQTAISSYHYLHDGLSLHYITPLLGPPWEIPLEFPLFQMSAAVCARWTGLGLDASGRLASWIFFIAALPACFLLLRRFNLAIGHRLLLLALLVLSPIYLYYSRAFLIESTALCLACWFLLCFERLLSRWHAGWLAGAVAFGAMAGMTKVTTFVVFLVVAFMFLVGEFRVAARGQRWGCVLRAGVAVLLPFLATVWWVARTSAIRHQNPEATFLDSHFGFWTFGDFSQRLSFGFWTKTFRVWTDSIVGDAGLLLGVFYFLFTRGSRRRTVLICLLAFLSGQLIFANLYWVHDYYFYASGLFLVAAVGFCLIDLLQHPNLPKWGQWALALTLLLLQVFTFDRRYFDSQQRNVPLPATVDLLRSISEPDDSIVVFGQDWDGALAYYTGRKALMFLTGRELDPASMQRSIERLGPSHVAAVVMSGFHWRDSRLVNTAMPNLHLGDRPFLFDQSDTGIWVPGERQDAIRDRYDARKFPSFYLAPVSNVPTNGINLRSAQIRRRREFDCLSPRPIKAFAEHDFALTEVNHEAMLVANATTVLTFVLPEKATKVSAIYGLADDSYINGHDTDGIEITVSLHPASGPEKVIYTHRLIPRDNQSDRGPQNLEVALPPGSSGELIVRLLPGPAGNASFDWSYIGRLVIK